MIYLKGKTRKFNSFNNLKINYNFKLSIVITNKILNQFTKISNDTSKIHTSLDYCRRNNYSKKMGYGFLITVILSNIYGTKFPGGMELCLNQECNFIRPYYINDKLIFDNYVVYKNKELGLLSIKNTVYRNNNEKIFEGKALLKIEFIFK
mgnify:FL=1